MKEYKNVFKENMIRIQDVVELTEKDFEKLGVTAIGLQLRLKQACRNHLQAKSEDTSPVLKKFFDLKKYVYRKQRKLRGISNQLEEFIVGGNMQ